MVRHVCVTGRVNGDGDRTGINPACYAYEVRSSGLIGFADFVGVALTFYVGAVIGCGECLGAEGLIDGEACPREVVNGFGADERMSTDFGCARG